MILSRSAEATPSSRLLSNKKFICRLGAAAGNLRDLIAFLPNDCDIVPGVCGVGRTDQYPLQLDECGQIDARRADCHSSANHRIEHPTGDRYHDACRPLHAKKLARRSLLHATHQDLAAEIWMIPVVDFQLLPDMGRMNGQWPSGESHGCFVDLIVVDSALRPCIASSSRRR